MSNGHVANPDDQNPNPNPTLPDPSAEPNAGGDGAGNDPEPEPQNFLDVNDQTSFKTREDAIKSFDEAGKRISELTPWVKEFAEEYGIENASEAAELMEELIELRKGTSKPDPNADKGAAVSPAKSELSPEDEAKAKAAEAWMEERGYVKKDVLDSVQAEIAELRQSRESDQTSRINDLIVQGRSTLSDLMNEAELPEKLHAQFERSVRAYIEDNGSRTNRQTGEIETIPGGASDRFFQGGAAQRAALKEALDDAMEVYSYGRESGSAGYQRDKEKAAKSNSKPVGSGNGAPPQTGDGMPEYGTPEWNKMAYEKYQSHLSKTE